MGIILVVLAVIVALVIVADFFLNVSISDQNADKIVRQARKRLGVDNLFGTAPDQDYLAAARKSYALENA